MIYNYLSNIHVWNDVHSHDSCNHDHDRMNYYDGDNKVYSDDDKLQWGRDDGNTLVSDIYCSHIHDAHIRNHRS